MAKRICEKCGKQFEGGPTAKLCSRCKDLTGKNVGNWTVLAKTKPHGRYEYYMCKCKCGNVRDVSEYTLRSGRSTSCGCERTARLIEEREDLTGMKYGELFVKGYSHTSDDKRNRFWKCICSCGKSAIVATTDLTTGRVKSCGHLIAEKASQIADCGTNPASIYSEKLSTRNKSGVKGVYYDKNKCKWIAEIMFQGKKYRLGAYYKKEDAIKARQAAENKLLGDFFTWYAEKYPEKWNRLKKDS